MTVEEWKEQVKKKIRFMTNYIWDGISTSDVDRFLTNFEGDNVIVGHALLDMLIYYSCEQEEFIVENLIRLLNRDLWITGKIGLINQSTEKIQEQLKKLYCDLCFVPVNDHGPSDSAYSLSSTYKKSDMLPQGVTFINPADIPLMIALKKKGFVFYDDIIGTGNQFRTFWSKTRHFGNYPVTLERIAAQNSDLHFYYLVLGGYQKSIYELQRDFPNLKIIASEVFTCDYNIFDNTNEYWEFNRDKKDFVLDYIKEKERALGSNSEFSLNLPVLFQHCRAPNTSLSLYWFTEQGQWEELYRR